MQIYRNLTEKEIKTLLSRGCGAENWDLVKVTEGFDPEAVSNCLFRGEVNIGRGVHINNIGSCISNYTIGEGAWLENVSAIETIGQSSFGNGIPAAVVNEGGGREVPLLDNLTAQTAYIMAMYRHRPDTVGKLTSMAEDYVRSVTSSTGTIGPRTRITNSGIIRNVRTGPGTVIEGATILSNGTINCTEDDPAFVGAGVKMYDFILRGRSEIDGGAMLRRCFVGEGVQICGLTATDSMFFANSHFENGEVCSIFAGPFTVSHHKSSLLIAGMFSFFNAGSGSNQSNHLFKTGAVHQGINSRGCKYGSDAYLVLPARTGAYTIVIGRHKSHHDTEDFPYSYLIEKSEFSYLVPGINLTNYGMVRDMEKWRKRDRRGKARADLINFEEHNPFITERIINAISVSQELLSKENGDEYVHRGIRIRSAMLRKGLKWYSLARDKFIGGMLADGPGEIKVPDYEGKWIDVAGMYMPKKTMDRILDEIDAGKIASMEQLVSALSETYNGYRYAAYHWALSRLEEQLERSATTEDIASAIEKGAAAAAKLKALTDQDRLKDEGISMSVGYGIDTDEKEERLEDYRRVRRL